MITEGWRLVAAVVVCVLVAFIGIRMLDATASRADRVAGEIEDLTGVESAVAHHYPELAEDDDVPLTVRMSPSASAPDIAAVLSRAGRAAAADDDGGVDEVSVRLGAARVDVGRRVEAPSEIAAVLRALAPLRAGTTLLEPDGTIRIDPGSAGRLGVARQAVAALSRGGGDDLSVIVSRSRDNRTARVWVHSSPAVARRVLDALAPVGAQVTTLEVGEDVRLTARTSSPAQLGQLFRTTQAAARTSAKALSVSVTSADVPSVTLSGAGDPAPALAVIEQARRRGLTVDDISTDRSTIRLVRPGFTAKQLTEVSALVAALAPPLPKSASVSVGGAPVGDATFEGTPADLARVAPKAAELGRRGYDLTWSGGDQRPSVGLTLPAGTALSRVSATEAMRILRSLSWPGVAKIGIHENPADSGSNVTFSSTAAGQASQARSYVPGLDEQTIVSLWKQSATGAGA